MQIFTSRACLAALSAAFLGSGVAYSEDLSPDQMENFRKQFQYGRNLVMVCRYTVHDVRRMMDCENDALFPNRDTKVSQATIQGAYYQMMIMEQEAGQLPVYAAYVRGNITRVFKGSADAYCDFWNVDCGPVIAYFEKTRKKNKP